MTNLSRSVIRSRRRSIVVYVECPVVFWRAYDFAASQMATGGVSQIIISVIIIGVVRVAIRRCSIDSKRLLLVNGRTRSL
jgi:hypothetical protein